MYSVSTKTSAHRRKPPEDLGLLTNDSVVIFPAVQPFILDIVNNPEAQKLLKLAGYVSFNPLNFLHEDGYFHYPFALVSAGNADLNIQRSHSQLRFLRDRNLRSNLLFVDSGGFSVATSALDIQAYFQRRKQWWLWLSDLAQTGPLIVAGMDVPTAAYRNKVPGIRSYEDCLSLPMKSSRLMEESMAMKRSWWKRHLRP